MCVNAETQKYHIECDCTYTLIHVPQQVRKCTAPKYHFNFMLTKDIKYSIPLNAGTSILFSGKYITHRQSCCVVDDVDDDTFFNFASYGNARLFRHIMKSFNRMKEVEKVEV